MSGRPLLLHDDILELHAAAQRLSLTREVLLVGLPQAFVQRLATTAAKNDVEKLLLDLGALNEEPMMNGVWPLTVWLRNAEHWSKGRREEALFTRLLRKVEAAAQPDRLLDSAPPMVGIAHFAPEVAPPVSERSPFSTPPPSLAPPVGKSGAAAAEEERAFYAFFGEHVRNAPVIFVLCHRRTIGEVDPFEYIDHRNELDLPKGIRRLISKDVDAWLAYEDLLVAEHLGQLFFDRCHQRSKLCLDGKLGDAWKAHTTVALGLGYTPHTRRLLADDDLDLHVQIVWPRDGADILARSDAIVFNGEYFGTGGKVDHALIARVVTEGRVHFICAGRTAPGTTAAGRYLAAHWKQIAARYPQAGLELAQHSLAVLLEYKTREADLLDLSKMRIRDHAPQRDPQKMDPAAHLRQGILGVLAARNIPLRLEDRERIRTEEDLKLLKSWLAEAVVAENADVLLRGKRSPKPLQPGEWMRSEEERSLAAQLLGRLFHRQTEKEPEPHQADAMLKLAQKHGLGWIEHMLLARRGALLETWLATAARMSSI